MNDFEKINQPVIKSPELLSLIETIKWIDGYKFSFHGTNYLLVIISSEIINTLDESEDAGEAAEIYYSTAINGFDIYLHDTIPEISRKQILFHEILEANLMTQGFGEIAHKLATKETEKIFSNQPKSNA